MLSKVFKKPSLNFKLIYFRNLLNFMIDNFLKMSIFHLELPSVTPDQTIDAGKNPSLGLLFILMLCYSKPFCNTLNYASTLNIEEVIEFYN